MGVFRQRSFSRISHLLSRRLPIVDQLEAVADDPGEEWRTLPDSQRWGYLRLISHLGTATHELHRNKSSPGSVSSDVVASKAMNAK